MFDKLCKDNVICCDDNCQRCANLIYDKYIEQKAEIERLKECPKCVYEYDGEVIEYCVQGPCPNFKTVEQIKTEAYKEFAEKLEEKLCDCHTVSDGEYCGFDCGDTHECIDDLLEEMVGERKMTDLQDWLFADINEIIDCWSEKGGNDIE